MANMRAIRARIKSVESTRQITASMKAIAASKLRRVQTLQGSLKGFERETAEALGCLLCGRKSNSPFVKAPGGRGKVCYVLFIGNRGMCGIYNIALLKWLQAALEKEERECTLAVCGRWGKDQLSNLGVKTLRFFDEIGDAPEAKELAPLTAWLLEGYLGGEYEEIRLVYQEFISVLKQEPASKQLLPLQEHSGRGHVRYILEPNEDSVRQRLEHMYIENTLYSTLLEAKRGEHASRMAAMTAAADNTDELLSKLQLQLNHARQAAITTEISEIAGGAAALRGE